tara:strand:+ start:894 stop:2768 length:1875 start_codon:yes stop_codon:yes gene_type:complete
MTIQTEFSVDSSGNIRHDGVSSNNYTVLELHRYLQGLADDASASGDDDLDITDPNPSSRSTDSIITLLNGYNIDDDAAQHLYGGSITQDSGNVIYSGLSVVGSVNSASTQLQIVQNNSLLTNYWTTGINNSGNTLLRLLVKTRTGGSDIDGKRVRVQAREFGDSYDFFNITLGEGESVAAISTVNDAQNDTASGTVASYNVTNTEGYQTINLDNGSGAEPYYSKWTYNAEADELKALWEFGKYITRRGTSSTIHGINGELFLGITHYYSFNNSTGVAFTEDEVISWSTGTGLLLALDSSGSKAYIQLLTGVAPTAGTTIDNQASNGTHDVDGSVTEATVPDVFLGSYTGSLNGAYGIGVDPDDLSRSDTIVDLNNDSQSPLAVTVTVSGLSEGSAVQVIANETVGTVTSGDVLSQGLANASGVYAFSMNYEAAFGAGLDVIVRCRNQGFPTAGIAASSGGTSFTDETTANNSTTTDDITLLPASAALNDAYYWGHGEKFDRLKLDVSQAGGASFASLTWEYYNGSSWTALSNVSDATNNYKNSGNNIVSWDSPAGWATTTVNSQGPYYYVRARQNSGSPSGTQPLGRKVKLDVTKYLPFTQNNTVTSNGLTVVATWVKDTISTF